jgi:arabinofuranosyltransferase
MRSSRSRLIYLAIVILALGARLLPGPRTIDDAYITFRYARNLLDGQGMVYNPGERVLGTTTPLYTFLLAGIGLVSGGTQAPFPWIALIVNAISDAVTCILLIEFARNLGYKNAGIGTAVVWAVAPMSVTFAIGGMETSFFIALMTATFYFYSKEKPAAAAALASLSLLTRPDALLFVLPLMIERLRRSLPLSRFNPQPSPIRLTESLAFLLPLFIWSGFAFPYFGSPLPNSIAAKAAAYTQGSNEAFIRLLQHYATPFLEHLIFTTKWIMFGLVLYTFLYLSAVLRILKKWRGGWPIFLYPWLYFLAFSIANPLIFRWYLTPPLPIFFLGIFLGVNCIAQDLKRPVLLTVFSLIALMLTLNGWTIRPDHGPSRPAPDMAFIKLELLYQRAALSLKDQIRSDQVLAAGDIGVLGYTTGARILDAVGLITPISARYYPLPPSAYVINYAISSDLILEQKPDFLVLLEVYGRNTLLPNASFQETYHLIEELDTDLYQSRGMLIFARKGQQ